MASDIEITADASGDVEYSDVREALVELGTDDLTEKSPVTPGLSEAGVRVEDGAVTIIVAGHAGEWSKTSQESILTALRSVEGVENADVISGGYEPE